jgi:hypothetical protein
MNELALFAGAAMKTHWKSSEYAREKAKAWRLANPDRVKEYRQANRRSIYLTESARKYGITRERFAEMMATQGEACATCRRPFDWGDKQTKPHIDHCHSSKKVRGILCNRCNTVLGLCKDDYGLINNLAEYLRTCHG